MNPSANPSYNTEQPKKKKMAEALRTFTLKLLKSCSLYFDAHHEDGFLKVRSTMMTI